MQKRLALGLGARLGKEAGEGIVQGQLKLDDAAVLPQVLGDVGLDKVPIVVRLVDGDACLPDDDDTRRG